MEKFVYSATTCRADFEAMTALPKGNAVLQNMIAKWELFIDDHYDVDEIIHESRPYAAASMRYHIYDNGKLTYDPFGYYNPRKVGGTVPDQYQAYVADYPMTDEHWSTNHWN